MSPSGDDSDEMRLPRRDDETFERLLAGAPTGDEDLTRFVAGVRSLGAAPAPRASTQLAAMLADGLVSTDKGDLPATAASNAYGPAAQAAGLPKWRKKPVILETLLGKAAAAALGLTVATGTAAAAGALPAAVQKPIARAVEAVTPLEIPGGRDRAPERPEVADEAPEVEVVEDPEANDFGGTTSDRAQDLEPGEGRELGETVSGDRRADAPGDAPAQRPATTPTAKDNPGTEHRPEAPAEQAPSEQPTAEQNPSEEYRSGEAGEQPEERPSAESNPGTGARP